MSMVHVHVHASCPCCKSMFTPHIIGVWGCGGVRVRVRVRVRMRVRVRVYKCRNAELSGIRSVWYRTEKTNDAGTGPVLDQAKAVRHFFVRYRTGIIDAGMPMPALVSSMPMPSYAGFAVKGGKSKVLFSVNNTNLLTPLNHLLPLLLSVLCLVTSYSQTQSWQEYNVS
jgi:hypothetical protein